MVEFPVFYFHAIHTAPGHGIFASVRDDKLWKIEGIIERFGESSVDTLAREILILTKLNWNSCAFASSPSQCALRGA